MSRDRTLFDLEDEETLARIGEMLAEWTADPSTRPEAHDGMTVEQATLKALADKGLVVDASVERVHLHQSSLTDFHLVLPPAELLAKGFETIENDPEGYSIQDVYFDFTLDRRRALGYDGTKFDEPDEVKEFYNFRLADYCLQHCM